MLGSAEGWTHRDKVMLALELQGDPTVLAGKAVLHRDANGVVDTCRDLPVALDDLDRVRHRQVLLG